MNIAIFGGSFNPPHRGHKAIMKSALQCEWIDFIIILPNFQNPLKPANKAFLSDEMRLKSLESMIKNIIDSAKLPINFYKIPPQKSLLNNNLSQKHILLSSLEISQKKPSFSIDSINYFYHLYRPKNLYFIIGADILDELKQWHKIDEIRQKATFIIATRNNIPIPSGFLQFHIDENISSTQIRANDNFNDFVAESSQNHNKGKNLNIDKITQKRLDSIISLLDSKKAENIMLFDLQKSSYITQFVIIATSLADKHSFALLDTLKTELKAQGEVFYSTDEESGDWIIADLGEIMIHIFTENHRKKFNLEEFLENYQKQK